MLDALAFPQTTNVDEIARRNFLGSQVPAVFNSILPNNLLIHSQPNTKVLWAHLLTLIGMSSPASIFANY